MKIRIQNLNPIRQSTIKIRRGKLNQKGKMRERGIPTWGMMQLAAKGIQMETVKRTFRIKPEAEEKLKKLKHKKGKTQDTLVNEAIMKLR